VSVQGCSSTKELVKRGGKTGNETISGYMSQSL
jgi:hypothetical protein